MSANVKVALTTFTAGCVASRKNCGSGWLNNETQRRSSLHTLFPPPTLIPFVLSPSNTKLVAAFRSSQDVDEYDDWKEQLGFIYYIYGKSRHKCRWWVGWTGGWRKEDAVLAECWIQQILIANRFKQCAWMYIYGRPLVRLILGTTLRVFSPFWWKTLARPNMCHTSLYIFWVLYYESHWGCAELVWSPLPPHCVLNVQD